VGALALIVKIRPARSAASNLFSRHFPTSPRPVIVPRGGALLRAL